MFRSLQVVSLSPSVNCSPFRSSSVVRLFRKRVIYMTLRPRICGQFIPYNQTNEDGAGCRDLGFTSRNQSDQEAA